MILVQVTKKLIQLRLQQQNTGRIRYKSGWSAFGSQTRQVIAGCIVSPRPLKPRVAIRSL